MVLAGGRARRLGGVDKPALVVDGVSLLDHVLAACAGADPLVVVGERRPVAAGVRWTRERPAHAGPLAAVAAGLAEVPATATYTALLAADLPGVRPTTLRRLLVAATGESADGALLVDGGGRPQWLTGVWRTAAIRAALADVGDPADRPLRAALDRLRAVRLPALGDEAVDVDTPADLATALDRRPAGRDRP